MSRKGARQTVFVCAGISANNELVTRIIEAETPQAATELFLQQASVQAKDVLGPFYKKKTQVIESTRALKFSPQSKRAIYNDWIVDAFILQEPENQAYLVFIKRADNKKMPFPKGTIVVPVTELRFV